MERKLRWELEDMAEIRDEVGRMVCLGTATMNTEEQRRWQEVIDATFATHPSISAKPSTNINSKPGHIQSTATETRKVLPVSKQRHLLFGGRGEDDGGDIYSLAGN